MTYRLVVMGVMGAGKSLIAAGLADTLGIAFVDGDDLHPKSNIAKMARGEALTNTDRAPWLELVGAELVAGDCVIACSALRRDYRDIIREAAGAPVCFLWLNGSKETLVARVNDRSGHFMPAKLLDSQLATLEPLEADEWFIEGDFENSPSDIVAHFVKTLEE